MEKFRGRCDQATAVVMQAVSTMRPKDDLPGPSHRHLGGIREKRRAVAVALSIRDHVTDQSQAHVDDGKQRTRDNGRRRGSAHDLCPDAAPRCVRAT